MIGSELKDQNIPVRDKQGYDQSLPNVSFAPDARIPSDIQEEVLIPKERGNVIESALSRFRSGVEKVYSESRERSLGRMKVSEDEMSRKFSIGAVMQNDISELNKIGAENITKYLGEESAQILEQAAQMDCYVIREQLKSSQNKDEEEERAYREEIEKLRRKNIDLEQRIQQKKRLNKIENSMKQSSSTSRMAIQVINRQKNSSNVNQHKIQQAPTPAFQQFQPIATNVQSYERIPQLNQLKSGVSTLDNKEIQNPFNNALVSSLKENSFDLSNIGMVAPTQEIPDVQVIYEGKQRDMGRCLRKFAKKIFYLQKQVELLIQEKNKWKAECEISDKNYKEVKVKYEEILEVLKLNEKKGQEMRIETEKYKTISVSLEEELARLKAFPPSEPEIQIIEKIIEKPIEIIKHVILEKIIEKPIEIIKTIEVPPIEIEKLVEKIVEVPVEKIVEKIINAPHEIIVEKIVEVPKVEIIEREKIVEVPRIEYVDRVVTVEKPIYIDRPAQVQREMVEVRNEGAERELSFLREDFRRLQLCLEQSQHEIEEWREKYNQSQENLHIGDSNAAIHFERERSELIEELRGNRETISDLRQRIELLYKEITTLSEQNNRKNLDMTNQIRLLEDQLFTFAPRLISNTATHFAHVQPQVYADSPIQIQNLSPIQSYPNSSQVINPNLYVNQAISSTQQQQQQQQQSQYQMNSSIQQIRGPQQSVNQNQVGQNQYQQDQIKKQVAFSSGIQQQGMNDQTNNDTKTAQFMRSQAQQYPPTNRPLNENGLRYKI